MTFDTNISKEKVNMLHAIPILWWCILVLITTILTVVYQDTDIYPWCYTGLVSSILSALFQLVMCGVVIMIENYYQKIDEAMTKLKNTNQWTIDKIAQAKHETSHQFWDTVFCLLFPIMIMIMAGMVAYEMNNIKTMNLIQMSIYNVQLVVISFLIWITNCKRKILAMSVYNVFTAIYSYSCVAITYLYGPDFIAMFVVFIPFVLVMVSVCSMPWWINGKVKQSNDETMV